MPHFGENFRAVLKERGLTQIAAAQLLGISQSVISYYSNLDRPPRRGTLLNIADRLGVSVGELSTGKKSSARKNDVPVDMSDQIPLRALQNLRRRWKTNPNQRDAIAHLVSLLFPRERDEVLTWLKAP